MKRQLTLFVLVCGGCNAIFGVDDLVVGPSAPGGGDVGGGGAGGATPTAGGMGGVSQAGGMGGGGMGGGAIVPWWDDAFGRRVRIDFAVGSLNGDAIDVPIAVRLDDSVIDAGAVSASGTDLRFVDATQQVVLDHEVASWVDQVGGHVWVQVPRIDATTDHMWLYYDSPNAQVTGGSVFESFHMVHHFESEASGQTPDAAGSLDGTLMGGAALAQGVVGSGVELTSPGDEVTFADDEALEPVAGEVRTLSVWLRTTEAGSQPIWIKESNCRGWTMGLRAASTVDGAVRTSATGCDDHVSFVANTSVVANDGAWHHVALIADRVQNEVVVVVDGAVAATATGIDDNPSNLGLAHLGHNPFGPMDTFTGTFDELWVTDEAHGEPWFSALYLNGLGTLLSFGTDEPQP